jgi:hypothetical protein
MTIALTVNRRCRFKAEKIQAYIFICSVFRTDLHIRTGIVVSPKSE